MNNIFGEIAMDRAVKYESIMQQVPEWFKWVYWGAMAVSVIYAAFGTRTINRLFWITVSFIFPFVALPVEIAADIVSVQFRKKHSSNPEDIKKKCRLPFRARFVVVPAIGALVGLSVRSAAGNFSSLFSGEKTPLVLMGALLAMTILLLTEYRNSRKNIWYFKIVEKGREIDQGIPACNIYGHLVNSGSQTNFSVVDLIVKHFLKNPRTFFKRGVQEINVDGTIYTVTVLNKADYGHISDIETVSTELHHGCVYDRITCVEWTCGKNDALTDNSSGIRNVIWRVAPLNPSLAFEALTSAVMCLVFITPAGLSVHSSMLGLFAGWFAV